MPLPVQQPMIGTSLYHDVAPDSLHQVGIGWVRQGIGFEAFQSPQALSGKFDSIRQKIDKRRSQGVEVMAHTPLFGNAVREPSATGVGLDMVFKERMPTWMGSLGSAEFVDHYRTACRTLASSLRGVVDCWQIANELDLPIFAGPLDPKQACELILAAAQGLREGNPDAIIGTNHTGYKRHYYMLGRLYEGTADLIDYCGVDAYYGTWETGGPDDWADRIAELHALSGRPVLVNEWGYASAGGLMTEQQRLAERWPCEVKAWRFAWDEGHTEPAQARFIERAFTAFASQASCLMGCFFYRWEDQPKCWQCGLSDCPAEIAWGLVREDGSAKPSLDAFADGVARLKAAQSELARGPSASTPRM